MRVEIVYNPGSGRGRAERTALRFERALAEAGHAPVLNRVGAGSGGGKDADVLVLVGGDGTVKHALGAAIARGVPVYHVPLGNENLFAREFGMDREPATLLAAIEARRVRAIDVGVVEGDGRRDRFSIMLSVGPDASVIHRMERDGRSVLGHMAYLAPIGDELASPGIVPITADVDGRRVVDGVPGLVVVANLRRYAFGINPAADADPRDGMLDLVFIPATTVWPLFCAAAWGLAGRLGRMEGVVTLRGREVLIDAPGGCVQVDGEALHTGMPLRLGVEAGVLRVLAPEVRARG